MRGEAYLQGPPQSKPFDQMRSSSERKNGSLDIQECAQLLLIETDDYIFINHRRRVKSFFQHTVSHSKSAT